MRSISRVVGDAVSALATAAAAASTRNRTMGDLRR